MGRGLRPNRRRLLEAMSAFAIAPAVILPSQQAKAQQGPGDRSSAPGVFQSRKAAAGAWIATEMHTIATLAYAVAGDGGAGRYIRGVGPVVDFKSADGATWVLDPTLPNINAQMFGAVGDGEWRSSTGEFSGTDDRAAIQSMFNWALVNKVADVHLIKSHRISGPLHLGWGETFTTMRLHGNGRGAYPGRAGVHLLCDFHDAMGINIQGGRRSGVQGITLVGKNYRYTESAQVGDETLSDDPSDWVDPAIKPAVGRAGGIERFSPYAGITIDAYSGATPAGAYPSVAYPTFTGVGPARYQKALSSDTTIEDCVIIGFGVGICQSPNSPEQGDFLRVRNGYIGNCAYGISIGNHQSRNVEVRNLLFRGLHTCLTNSVHGDRAGVFGGPIENCSLGHCYQFVDFRFAASLKPVVIKDLYFETSVRVGVVGDGVAAHFPVVFEGGQWSLSQALLGRYPRALIEAGTQAVVLRSVAIASDNRIPVLISQGAHVTIDGGHWGGRISDLTGTAGKQRAINYSGGVFLPQAQRGAEGSLRIGGPVSGAYRHSATSTSGFRMISDSVSWETSAGLVARAPIAQTHREMRDVRGRHWWLEGPAAGILDFASASFVKSAPEWRGDVMSFTYRGVRQSSLRTALSPGSLIYAVVSGTLFVVTSIGERDGNGDHSITCLQLNNLRLNIKTGEVIANDCPNLKSRGIAYISHANIDLPREVAFGAFVSGSSSVVPIAGSEGSSEIVAGGLAAPVRLHGTPAGSIAGDRWPIRPDGATISPNSGDAPSGAFGLSHDAVSTGIFPIYPVPIR